MGGLLSLLFVAVAVLLGAWIPVNGDFVSSEEGVRIYVSSGPIHTDLIVPVTSEVWNWDGFLDRERVKRPDSSYDHLAFGWGSRTFYLQTRTWDDVKAVNVARAFFGLDSAAMHVEWRAKPRSGPDCRALVLSSEEYERLCRSIWESFHNTEEGQPRLIEAPGYGDGDVFYEGTSRYTFYRTCNTWTGRRLADAGVRVGLWTPTPWSVMRQIPTVAP